MRSLSTTQLNDPSLFIRRTAHRYPFSLISETRKGAGDSTVTRTGDVTDQMDRMIGRPVIQIKGIVSAKNTVDFSNLALTG